MTRFKNKYRIESTRFQDRDYGNAGFYYVTICTHDRIHHFGEILAGKMQHSLAGKIVVEEWHRAVDIRPNVQMDEWIVMPNHLHLVVNILYKIDGQSRPAPAKDNITANASKKWHGVTLGSIIGQFKRACTIRIKTAGYDDFRWQPRFYERVLHTPRQIHIARRYTINNPKNWRKDSNSPPNLYM